VLDMGEPINILELARNVIRLSGFEPERDIRITFTGLRPGEKLFEELKLDGEGVRPTSHSKIRVLNGGDVQFEQVRAWLEELSSAVERRSVHGVVSSLARIVPEYHPSPSIVMLCEVDRHDRAAEYRRARVDLLSTGGQIGHVA
jgi:FlaA1/EpsC-like NDP-sugar epimerase